MALPRQVGLSQDRLASPKTGWPLPRQVGLSQDRLASPKTGWLSHGILGKLILLIYVIWKFPIYNVFKKAMRGEFVFSDI